MTTAIASQTEIMPPEPANSASGPSALAILNDAVMGGASVDVVERLVALHERWEANAARKAFDSAMAAAKSEIPTINKNRVVDFETNNGSARTTYRHEDLGEIARTVDPVLARHGLSYRYRTTSNVNEPVTVTCIVSHRDGHFVENTLSAGRDDSGKKNSIQQVGSTITYLQRYTLKAALGLAASYDDDGKSSEGEDTGPISDEQLATIRALIDETGTDIQRFCKYFKIDALPDLPASKIDAAITSLNTKKKAVL